MRNILHNQKGAALPVVLGIIVVGTLVALGLLGFLFNEVSKSQTVTEGIQAKYAAEAGVERMLNELNGPKPEELINIKDLSCSPAKVSTNKINEHNIRLSCDMTDNLLILKSEATGEHTHTTTVTLKVTQKSPLRLEVESWK